MQEADRLEQAAKSLGVQSTRVDPNPVPLPPQKKFEPGPGSWTIDATNVMEGAAEVLNPVPHVVNFYEQEKKAVELVLQGEPALAAIEHGKASPLGHGLLGVLGQADKELLNDLALQADLLHGIPHAMICPDIVNDDIVFLNRYSRYFLSNARSNHLNYHYFKLMIYQLFALVASQRRSDLEWPGPELNEDERRTLNLDSQ